MNIIKMRYSIKPRDRIYVKGYGFLSFSKNMGRNLSSNTVKIDSAKESTTNAIKTASKKAIQNTAEATGELIDNKIPDKITSVWKTSAKTLQNDETDVERAIPKKR